MGNFWILPILQSLSEMFITFTGRGDADLHICPSRALHILHSKLYQYAGKKMNWQNGTLQLRGHGRSVRLRGLESCQPRR